MAKRRAPQDLIPLPDPGSGEGKGLSTGIGFGLLIETFFKGKDEETIRAYKRDLADLQEWMGAASVDLAVKRFLQQGAANANLMGIHFKDHLVKNGKSPATVNRHMTALRSLVKLARTLGIVGWTLEVQNLQNETYRDTRGPGEEVFQERWRDLTGKVDPMSVRDRAILGLIHDAGLRRDEVVTLNLESVDFRHHRLWVKAKKRTAPVEVRISPKTEECVEDWIRVRGNEAGPLFRNFDRAGKGEGLSGSAIARICHKYGLGRPHGIRHLAITTALEVTDGNIAEVQKFSRQKDPKTVMLYNDKREDKSGDISAMLAEVREGRDPKDIARERRQK